jgi:putative addiction module killer protein
MYYAFRGQHLLLMLTGGNKSSQRSDIEQAIALQQTIEE